MSRSLNEVTLIGNLGQDPEIRHRQDGSLVVNFTMATTESWRDRNTGEQREKTEWHNIAIFSEGLCKVVQSYLCKGMRIFIRGNLQTEKWQDQNGNDRYRTRVALGSYNSKLIILDKKDQDTEDAPPSPAPKQKINEHNDSPNAPLNIALDDDIPF